MMVNDLSHAHIVTTQANELMAEIHNSNQRMPVIIDPEIRDIWLGDDNESALELAVPYRDGELTAEPISTASTIQITTSQILSTESIRSIDHESCLEVPI